MQNQSRFGIASPNSEFQALAIVVESLNLQSDLHGETERGRERECLHPLLPHLPFSPPSSFLLLPSLLFSCYSIFAFSVAAPLKHLDRSEIGNLDREKRRERESGDEEMTGEHAEVVGWGVGGGWI